MEVGLSPRSRTIVIWVGLLAAGFILLDAAHALRPFIWAVITAYLLHPLVSLIHRKTRLPKHLITLWLYAMLGLLITLLVINVGPSLIDQGRGLNDEIPQISTDIEQWINDNQQARLQQLGIDDDYVNQRLDELGTRLATELSSAALPVLVGTVAFTIELLIYLVASFYFVVHGDRFVASFRSLLRNRYYSEFDRLILEINSTLGAYIRGQAILVAFMSAAAFAILTVLGIKYALILAIATGFLELIPLIGPWAAAIMSVTVSIFQDGTPFGWSHLSLAMVIGLAYFALRQLEDAFVIPNVIGRIVHLHPLLVIFCVVVGTALGGILGLILAVPISAVIKIIATYFYGKLVARDQRTVEVITTTDQLRLLAERMSEHTNETLVLLLEPGVLTWTDIDLVRSLNDLAFEHSVSLRSVTPDGIAGSLLEAIGIPTTTVPSMATEPASVLGI